MTQETLYAVTNLITIIIEAAGHGAPAITGHLEINDGRSEARYDWHRDGRHVAAVIGSSGRILVIGDGFRALRAASLASALQWLETGEGR